MSELCGASTRPEFFVRTTWNGKLVLQIRHFKAMPLSGDVRDAIPGDLPQFFEQLEKGRR